jgi:hypothetical protein
VTLKVKNVVVMVVVVRFPSKGLEAREEKNKNKNKKRKTPAMVLYAR